MPERLTETLLVMGVGMGGVLLTLTLLAGLIALLRAGDEALNRRRIRRYDEARARAGPAPEELDDERVAVIAAAAAETLRRPVVVRRLRFLRGDGASAWSVSGRLNVMASHQVTKGRPSR